MKDFKIGQAVTVRGISEVDYVSWPKFPSKDGAIREVIDHPCEPFNAVIIGKVIKTTGTYNVAHHGHNYGGEEDYSPAYLAVDKSYTFWQVRIGMFNMPLLVRDENLDACAAFSLPGRALRPKRLPKEPVAALLGEPWDSGADEDESEETPWNDD